MVVLLRLYTTNAGEKTPVSVVRYPSESSLLPNLRMPPLYSAGSGWPLHWTPCKFAVSYHTRLYCMHAQIVLWLASPIIYSIKA